MHLLGVDKVHNCPFKGTAPVISSCAPKVAVFAHFSERIQNTSAHRSESVLLIYYKDRTFCLGGDISLVCFSSLSQRKMLQHGHKLLS